MVGAKFAPRPPPIPPHSPSLFHIAGSALPGSSRRRLLPSVASRHSLPPRPSTARRRPAEENKLEDVLVTPDFDVQPSVLSEYYKHLEGRLSELQNLLGSQGAALPSTYEKYLHGSLPAGTNGNPMVSAKEYYEQLKQLRADSQVCGGGGWQGEGWGAQPRTV